MTKKEWWFKKYRISLKFLGLSAICQIQKYLWQEIKTMITRLTDVYCLLDHQWYDSFQQQVIILWTLVEKWPDSMTCRLLKLKFYCNNILRISAVSCLTFSKGIIKENIPKLLKWLWGEKEKKTFILWWNDSLGLCLSLTDKDL